MEQKVDSVKPIASAYRALGNFLGLGLFEFSTSERFESELKF